VIFLGPPDVGKTHLSVALAEAAIRAGLGAYFITAHDLATDLGRAHREGRSDRRMRIYLAPKVLAIDEVGYLPLDDVGTARFTLKRLLQWKEDVEADALHCVGRIAPPVGSPYA
jgi:DNA replication protein DnaC